MADFLNRTKAALGSKGTNFLGDALGKVNDPRLREALGGLGDTVFPGLFGGTPDLRDNAYAKLIQTRLNQTGNELAGFTKPSDQIQTSTALSPTYDWRARLRPKNGGAEQFYSSLGEESFLLQPLRDAGGLVWQYTPQIFLSGSADYNQALAQGMNYPINTFISSRPPDIPVQAEFTASDIYEARYLLSIIVFLRVATKAQTGDAAVAKGIAGTPPPVFLFEYLGDHGFNKVPVVITNYQIELPSDVDYVPVVVGDTTTYVPAKTSILINLSPTYTPHKLRKNFSLDDVANGRLYKGGYI